MKKIAIIIVLFFWVVSLKINAQEVFGWQSANITPFSTNDTSTLSASTDVNTNIPIIPGYNNQYSLQMDITCNGSGYQFLTNNLSQPITMSLVQCNFIIKSYVPFTYVQLIINYQNDWYFPIYSSTSIGNNWLKVENHSWTSVTTGQPFPADSATIETCILLVLYNQQNNTITLDSWYYQNYGNTPILYCGFGDILSGLENIKNPILDNYSLLQNYPNPFNPSTKIRFTIPISNFTNLTVYNILGQPVATLVNQELPNGTYEYEFNSLQLPSGNYFYTLSANGQKLTKKMTLLR